MTVFRSRVELPFHPHVILGLLMALGLALGLALGGCVQLPQASPSSEPEPDAEAHSDVRSHDAGVDGALEHTDACSESDEEFCARLGKNCGLVEEEDLCGEMRRVECGSCAMPETCGGGGEKNVCGCDTVDICSELREQCGVVDLSTRCSNRASVDCGTCGEHGACSSNRCHCEEGYTFDGVTCVDVDECVGDEPMCSENAECINVDGGFECKCVEQTVAHGEMCVNTPTVAQVATGASSEVAVVTTETELTAVPGDLYVALIAIRTYSRSVDRVVGLGLEWQRRESHCAGDDEQHVEMWIAQGMPTGDDTVTAELSGMPYNTALAVVRVTGVDPQEPVGSSLIVNTNGIDGSCATDIAQDVYAFDFETTHPGAMVLSFIGNRYRRHEPGAGFTELFDFTVGSGYWAGLAGQVRAVGTPGPVVVDGSLSGSLNWVVGAIEIYPAP